MYRHCSIKFCCRLVIFSVLVWGLSLPLTAWATSASDTNKQKISPKLSTTKQMVDNSITFVYGDRELAVAGCKRAWGLVILLSFDGKQVLFNAGGDPKILANNLNVLGISPSSIDAVVLSHIHWEMVAGIEYLLRNNPTAPIYATSEILTELQPYELCKGRLFHIDVASPLKLTPNIILMNLKSKPRHGGPFGIEEIHIIVKTNKGLAILVGCGHPEIINEVEKSILHTRETRLHLLVGGFHLLGPGNVVNLPDDGGAFVVPSLNYSHKELTTIVNSLVKLGVKTVIPTHCTGKEAEEIFKLKFKDRYIYQKLGMTVPLPPPMFSE